jgi:hypothetical protein
VHDEDDDRHHRRTEDRRVRPHEDDEPDQQDDRACRPRRATETGCTPQHHDEGDDHRAVRTGHRRQVCQRAGLHRRLGLRVEPAPVADREAPQQRSTRLWQAGGHVGEPGTGPVGHSEEAGRRLCRRRTAEEDHEGRAGPGVVGLDDGGRREPGAGTDVRPVTTVLRRHHPDRHVEPDDVVDRGHRRDHRPVGRGEVPVEDHRDGRRPPEHDVGAASFVPHHDGDPDEPGQRTRRQQECGHDRQS